MRHIPFLRVRTFLFVFSRGLSGLPRHSSSLWEYSVPLWLFTAVSVRPLATENNPSPIWSPIFLPRIYIQLTTHNQPLFVRSFVRCRCGFKRPTTTIIVYSQAEKIPQKNMFILYQGMITYPAIIIPGPPPPTLCALSTYVANKQSQLTTNNATCHNPRLSTHVFRISETTIPCVLSSLYVQQYYSITVLPPLIYVDTWHTQCSRWLSSSRGPGRFFFFFFCGSGEGGVCLIFGEFLPTILCLIIRVTGFQERLLVTVPLVRTTRWNETTRFFSHVDFRPHQKRVPRVQVWAPDSIFKKQKPDRRHSSYVRKTGEPGFLFCRFSASKILETRVMFIFLEFRGFSCSEVRVWFCSLPSTFTLTRLHVRYSVLQARFCIVGTPWKANNILRGCEYQPLSPVYIGRTALLSL